jgi:hypothetical protein
VSGLVEDARWPPYFRAGLIPSVPTPQFGGGAQASAGGSAADAEKAAARKARFAAGGGGTTAVRVVVCGGCTRVCGLFVGFCVPARLGPFGHPACDLAVGVSFMNAYCYCAVQDEAAKKAKRAERFGGGAVQEDEAKKKLRAERFGTA